MNKYEIMEEFEISCDRNPFLIFVFSLHVFFIIHIRDSILHWQNKSWMHYQQESKKSTLMISQFLRMTFLLGRLEMAMGQMICTATGRECHQ